MKRSRLILAILLVAIFLLAALPTTTFINDARGAEAPLAPGGGPPDTFVNAQAGEPQTLDPAWDWEQHGAEVIENVYETLVAYDGPDPTVLVPQLATAVPTFSNGGISPNGTDYTFDVRTGVLFHDGTVLTANDVSYSIKRVLVMNDVEGPAWMLGQMLLPTYPGPGFPVSEAEVNASMTVAGSAITFHLVKPFPAFLHIMAFTVGAVVSQAYVEAHGGYHSLTRNDWMSRHECGTGPYALQSWAPNVNITLERFADYRGPSPSIERVVIMDVPDEATREAMLASGNASSVYATRAALNDYLAMPDVRVIRGLPTLEIQFMGMNEEIVPHLDVGDVPASFFSDLHVRQAFAHAFDYDKYIDLAYDGDGLQPTGPIPYGMLGFDPTVPVPHFNLTRAGQELNLAMNPNAPGLSYADTGFHLVIYYRAGIVVEAVSCGLLRDGLQSLSHNASAGVTGAITVDVVPMYAPAYLDAQLNRWLPVMFAGWLADYPDPDDLAHPFCHESGVFPQLLGFANHTLTGLVEEAAVELNETQRLVLYSEIQRSCYDNAYYLFTVQPLAFHVERTWVQGTIYNPAIKGLLYFRMSLGGALPAAPAITGAVPTLTSVNLTWSTPASLFPITDYRVYYRSVYEPAELAASLLVGDVNSITINGLEPGLTYYFAVAAIAQSGEGPRSSEMEVATSNLLPGAPTIVSVTPQVGAVILNWTPPAPNGGSAVQAYRVYYSSDPISGPTEAHVDFITNATSAFVGVPIGSPYGNHYYFAVAARNSLGLGPLSASVNATVWFPCFLHLVASPSSSIGPVKVTLTGSLLSWPGADVSGSTIVLEYAMAAQGSRTTLATLTTNASGEYSCDWWTSIGVYYLFASYAGNTTNAPDHIGPIFLDLIAGPGGHPIAVSSSDAVTGLSYDANQNRLSFMVDATDALKCSATISFAKASISNVSALAVTTDGSSQAYTLESRGDMWDLKCNYTLGSHALVVDLGRAGGGAGPIDSTTLLLILVGLIAAIMVAGAGLFMMHKRKTR